MILDTHVNSDGAHVDSAHVDGAHEESQTHGKSDSLVKTGEANNTFRYTQTIKEQYSNKELPIGMLPIVNTHIKTMLSIYESNDLKPECLILMKTENS